jgi:hypothetical protein
MAEMKELNTMLINRFQNLGRMFSLLTVVVVFAMVASVKDGETGEKPEETIVVVGDDFVLTKADIDVFATFLKAKDLKWSEDTILKTTLKYELLSREYRKTNKGQTTSESPPAESSDRVAAKIQEGKKYLQSVLDNQDISNAVIESYYRTNPENFTGGIAPDGKNSITPLDDALKSEIRFKIIEKKKERITKDAVESLMIKYHVKILKEG